MTRRLTLILALGLATVASAADYRLETFAEDLDMPWCLAFLPDGTFLVTELGGSLRRISAAGEVAAPVAGVPKVYYAGQGGLFDVVPHPDYAGNSILYLSYAEGPPKDNGTVVAKAKLKGQALEELKVIFRVAPRKDTPVHYGGRMAFLPDGTLLLTTGDGFDYREAAQDLASQLGKTIRMNADGTPASGNPFPEAPYVFSYGHRNPQGLAVAADGTVYLHEHGPRGGDEVNVLRPGVNYGWPAITYGLDYSGARVSPYTEWEGMAQPDHQWTPSIAPSGLAIYAGDAFPTWRGDLFVGALVHREVRRLDLQNGKVVGEESLFGELESRIRDVRSGPDGTLYVITDGNPGKVLKVLPVGGGS